MSSWPSIRPPGWPHGAEIYRQGQDREEIYRRGQDDRGTRPTVLADPGTAVVA
jgi:hypothetical protein